MYDHVNLIELSKSVSKCKRHNAIARITTPLGMIAIIALALYICSLCI